MGYTPVCYGCNKSTVVKVFNTFKYYYCEVCRVEVDNSGMEVAPNNKTQDSTIKASKEEGKNKGDGYDDSWFPNGLMSATPVETAHTTFEEYRACWTIGCDKCINYVKNLKQGTGW